MRKNHSSLKSDRKRKTLKDTSLACDTNKIRSKKRGSNINKEYKKMIEAYRQAIRINPDDEYVHSNLGFAYGRIGMHKEAIEA